MIKSVLYHKVKNFDNWKKAFDSFKDFRKASGEICYSVGNIEGTPNTAYVINTWESLEKLNSFLTSKELMEAMGDAGALEKPHILILNEVDKG